MQGGSKQGENSNISTTDDQVPKKGSDAKFV